MPPRGNEGLDITPILTHYLFLFTSILAIAAWWIAFIAQAVASAKPHGSVGYLWFAIILEFFFILGVLYTLASDSIAMHRFQISVFGAVAIVFSVLGVQQGIFSGDPALDAMSAGWLILAIVNILWVLYFTSEEDSLAFHIFNLMGTGGLTPPSRRRRTTRGQSNMASNNGYATNYMSGGGIGPSDVPYDTKMGSGIGGGIRSQHSFGGISGDAGTAARSTLGAGTGGGSTHNLPAGVGSTGGGDTNLGPSSPLMGSGAAGVGAGLSGTSSPPALSDVSPPQPDGLTYKAKALYAYTASPDDPNEISFAKGEILDILDKQGKWWQAKRADGTVGIAPSNYLQII